MTSSVDSPLINYVYTRLLTCENGDDLHQLKSEHESFADIINCPPHDPELYTLLQGRLTTLPQEARPSWVGNISPNERSQNYSELFEALKQNGDKGHDAFMDLIEKIDPGPETLYEIRDSEGNTLLHIAMEYQQSLIIANLLDCTDCKLFFEVNFSGKFPIELALEREDYESALDTLRIVFHRKLGKDYAKDPRALAFLCRLKDPQLAVSFDFHYDAICHNNKDTVHPLKLCLELGKKDLALDLIRKVKTSPPILTACLGGVHELSLDLISSGYNLSLKQIDDILASCLAHNKDDVAEKIYKKEVEGWCLSSMEATNVIIYDACIKYKTDYESKLNGAIDCFIEMIQYKKPMEQLRDIRELMFKSSWSPTLSKKILPYTTHNIETVLKQKHYSGFADEIIPITCSIMLGLGINHLEESEKIISAIKNTINSSLLFHYLLKDVCNFSNYDCKIIDTAKELIKIIHKSNIPLFSDLRDSNYLYHISTTRYDDIYALEFLEWLLKNFTDTRSILNSQKYSLINQILTNYHHIKPPPISLCQYLIQNTLNICSPKTTELILKSEEPSLVEEYLKEFPSPIGYQNEMGVKFSKTENGGLCIEKILSKIDSINEEQLVSFIGNNLYHIESILRVLSEQKNSKPSSFEWLSLDSYDECLRYCITPEMIGKLEELYSGRRILLAHDAKSPNTEFWLTLFDNLIDNLHDFKEKEELLSPVFTLLAEIGVIPAINHIKSIKSKAHLSLLIKCFPFLYEDEEIDAPFEGIIDQLKKEKGEICQNLKPDESFENIYYTHPNSSGITFKVIFEESGRLSLFQINDQNQSTLLHRGYYNKSGFDKLLTITENKIKFCQYIEKVKSNDELYPHLILLEDTPYNNEIFQTSRSQRVAVALTSPNDYYQYSLSWIDLDSGELNADIFYLYQNDCLVNLDIFLKDLMTDYQERLDSFTSKYPQIIIDPNQISAGLATNNRKDSISLVPGHFMVRIGEHLAPYCHGDESAPNREIAGWDLAKVAEIKASLNETADHLFNEMRLFFHKNNCIPIQAPSCRPKVKPHEVCDLAMKLLTENVNFGACLWKQKKIWFFASTKRAQNPTFFSLPPGSLDNKESQGGVLQQITTSLESLMIDLKRDTKEQDQISQKLIHTEVIQSGFINLERVSNSKEFKDYFYKNNNTRLFKNPLKDLITIIRDKKLFGYTPDKKSCQETYLRMEIQLTQIVEALITKNDKESLHAFLTDLIKHKGLCGPQISDIIHTQYQVTFNLLDTFSPTENIEDFCCHMYEQACSETCQEILNLASSEPSLNQQIHVRTYIRDSLIDSGIKLPKDSRIPIELQTVDGDPFGDIAGREDYTPENIVKLFQLFFPALFIQKLYFTQFDPNNNLIPKVAMLLFQSFKSNYAPIPPPPIKEIREELTSIENRLKELIPQTPQWVRYEKLENEIKILAASIDSLARKRLHLSEKIDTLKTTKKRKYDDITESSDEKTIAEAYKRVEELKDMINSKKAIQSIQKSTLEAMTSNNDAIRVVIDLKRSIKDKNDELEMVTKKHYSEKMISIEERFLEEGFTVIDESTDLPYLSVKGVVELLKIFKYVIPLDGR